MKAPVANFRSDPQSLIFLRHCCLNCNIFFRKAAPVAHDCMKFLDSSDFVTWLRVVQVDPSYLSSHVNMAARLEAATKQYGVPVLMSHDFVNTLENKTNSFYCRKIDRVLLKGSTDKCTLYTYDLNYQVRTLIHEILTLPCDVACCIFNHCFVIPVERT